MMSSAASRESGRFGRFWTVQSAARQAWVILSRSNEGRIKSRGGLGTERNLR